MLAKDVKRRLRELFAEQRALSTVMPPALKELLQEVKLAQKKKIKKLWTPGGKMEDLSKKS